MLEMTLNRKVSTPINLLPKFNGVLEVTLNRKVPTPRRSNLVSSVIVGGNPKS